MGKKRDFHKVLLMWPNQSKMILETNLIRILITQKDQTHLQDPTEEPKLLKQNLSTNNHAKSSSFMWDYFCKKHSLSLWGTKSELLFKSFAQYFGAHVSTILTQGNQSWKPWGPHLETGMNMYRFQNVMEKGAPQLVILLLEIPQLKKNTRGSIPLWRQSLTQMI